jgi:hypothetical protein
MVWKHARTCRTQISSIRSWSADDAASSGRDVMKAVAPTDLCGSRRLKMARRKSNVSAVESDRHTPRRRQNWSRSSRRDCAEGQCHMMWNVWSPAVPMSAQWGHPSALSDMAHPESRTPLNHRCISRVGRSRASSVLIADSYSHISRAGVL